MGIRQKILKYSNLTIVWGWNLAFLVVAFAGIAPSFGPKIIMATLSEVIPLDFFVSLCLVMAIPLFSVGLFLTYARKQPGVQIRFFYGVEAPLFILALIRLFIFREMTLASAFLMGSILCATLLYAYSLLGRHHWAPEKKSTVVCHSLCVMCALYLGVLLALYTLPMAAFFLKGIFHIAWMNIFASLLENPGRSIVFLLNLVWWAPFFLLFALFSIALIIIMPFAVVTLYFQTWLHTFQHQTSKPIAYTITGSVLGAWIFAFCMVDLQPQVKTFALLEHTPTTHAEKHALLSKAEEVRKGLQNAYLYPYRYLAPKSNVSMIKNGYAQAFGLPSPLPRLIQDVHNLLLSPVLYKGQKTDDQKAADLYAAFFDTSIEKGEQKAILSALEATSNRNQAEAGLLNINEKKVWLSQQNVRTTQIGPHTKVEIHEVYENQTPQRQEIFYYFSLPENAVLTGLWLANGSDIKKRHAFLVAPRGSAQKVYKDVVKKQIDPALLEQVGPRQYRLRAFPIPPRPLSHNDEPSFFNVTSPTPLTPPPRLHLWLTYTSVHDATAPLLPELLEKRNVYWTGETKRVFNGTHIQTNDWMPKEDTPSMSTTPPLEAYLADEGYVISAQPVSRENPRARTPKKIAILIDTSYSMGHKKQKILDNIDWITRQTPHIPTDLILSQPHASPEKTTLEEISNLPFWGTLSHETMWQDALSLHAQNIYDGVFILTDQGSYELASTSPRRPVSRAFLPQTKAPIWLVHLDRLSPAYDDRLLSRLEQAQGGVAVGLKNAYHGFLARQHRAPHQRIHGELVWTFSKDMSPITPSNSLDHTLAAKMLIAHLSSQKEPFDPNLLDELHRIAKNHGIVTPYSSMIVLVTPQEKEALAKAEQENDRFNRSIEDGKEKLTKPTPFLSAVPEPEIALLLFISLVVLYVLSKRRSQNILGRFKP